MKIKYNNFLPGRRSDHVNLARLFKAGTTNALALSRGSDGWVCRSVSTVAAATKPTMRPLSRLWKAGL